MQIIRCKTNCQTKIFISAIAISILLTASTSSIAQGADDLEDAPADTSFSIQLFVPSPGPLNFFAVESPEIGDDMKPSIGLMLTYQHKPFVLLNCTEDDNCSDDSNSINAVKNFASLDIMGSFNFLKYFQVGLALPMQVLHGDGFIDMGTHAEPGDKYSAFIIGDIRIHLKARFIGEDKKDGPSLAVAVIPSLPISGWSGMGESDDGKGNDADGAHGYGGDGLPTVIAPKVMFGYRFGSLRSAVNLGALWRQKSRILSTEIGHSLIFGGAVGYAIIPEIEVIGEIYGSKLLISDNFADSESMTLEFLGGGRFRAKDFVFSLAAGGGILSGIGVPTFQIVAGAAWAPEEEEPEDTGINEWDIDGDGIDNESDDCPDQPEDKDGFQDEDGLILGYFFTGFHQDFYHLPRHHRS